MYNLKDIENFPCNNQFKERIKQNIIDIIYKNKNIENNISLFLESLEEDGLYFKNKTELEEFYMCIPLSVVCEELTIMSDDTLEFISANYLLDELYNFSVKDFATSVIDNLE